MSLHSADYVRDLVGHVPDKMLCLRQDEVSVISRMRIQHTRRVSLPSRLSGITEREHSGDGGDIQEHSDGGDIQESLNKSYIQMKTKLYELEEYNQKLEKQLSEIFSCISASVSKPPAQGVGNAGQQGKISTNTQTLPGATRASYLGQEESQGIECWREDRDEEGREDQTIIEDPAIIEEEESDMKTSVDSTCFKLLQSLQTNFQSEFITPEKCQQEIERGFKKRRKFRSINLSELVDESLETKPSNEELTQNNIKDDPGMCEVKKHTILHLVEDEAAKIPREEECEQDRANSIPLTQILSVSSIATSSHESLGILGYLSFHEESESVDEFFLFPEDVLNVNFETICEELALFSQDMGILLDLSNSSYLKAAKASHQGKTLWIYRGF